MSGQRKALIIANDTYEHASLRDLRAPTGDAEALRQVLGDPRIGAFDVEVLRNQPSHAIQPRIESLLTQSKADDFLLLHFACHGLKDRANGLFFATTDTRLETLWSTSVPADFVQRNMRRSRSRSIVLLLDCCFGGAFPSGYSPRTAGDAHVLDSFPIDRGRGRVVITASDATQFAFEGSQLLDDRSPPSSVFTAALINGLASGDADRNEDGLVSVGELYDYVYDVVQQQNPDQSPTRNGVLVGDLWIAHSPRRRIRPAPVTADLLAAVAGDMYARLGAIRDLHSLVTGDDLGTAAGAFEKLKQLAQDGNPRVGDAAAEALAATALQVGSREVHFGRVSQGTSPHEQVPLDGPALARACEVHPSASWILVDQGPDGLDISVDTSNPGVMAGNITLTGPTGSAVISVDADVVAPAWLTRHLRARGTARRQNSSAITGEITESIASPPDAPPRVSAVDATPTTTAVAERSSSAEPAWPDRPAPVADPAQELAQVGALPDPDPEPEQPEAPSADVEVDLEKAPAREGQPEPPRASELILLPTKSRGSRRRLISALAVCAGAAAIGVVAWNLLGGPAPAQANTSAHYAFSARTYPSQLVITRRWTLSGSDGSLLTEDDRASSTANKAVLVPFEDVIPTAIARRLTSIRFSPPVSHYDYAAHTVIWVLRIPAHGAVSVSYQVTVAKAGATRSRLIRWARDLSRMKPPQITNPASELQSLTISPHGVSIRVGKSRKLTLAGRLVNGKTASRSLLATALWMTSNLSRASVNRFGRVTGKSAGTTHVIASIGSVIASDPVRILSRNAQSGASAGSSSPTSQTSPSSGTTTHSQPTQSSPPGGGPTTITPSTTLGPVSTASRPIAISPSDSSPGNESVAAQYRQTMRGDKGRARRHPDELNPATLVAQLAAFLVLGF